MSPQRPTDDRDMVVALLESHGIAAPDADVNAIASGYAASRQMVATLYAMPGVRYEVPAATFDPRPGNE